MQAHDRPMSSGPPAQSVQVYCTSCGGRAESTYRFCGACGSPLAGAVTSPTDGPGLSATDADAGREALRVAQRLLDAGNTRDAIRAVEAVCEQQADWASARITLGIAYLRAGRVLDAQDALDAAERLAPGTFACEVAFAEYHARLGFYDRAVERLDRALGLAAPDPQARDAALELHRYCSQHAKKMFYRTTPLPRLPLRWRRHGPTPGTADTTNPITTRSIEG